MRDSKTKKTAQATSSDDIRLTAPKSWLELTQKQLRYVYLLFSLFDDLDIIKTYMLMRFCHISILGHYEEGWKCVQHTQRAHKVFYAKEEAYAVLLHHFDFIGSYDDMNVRLDDIQCCHAVDVNLHGVSFIDYLNMEKAYQGYLISKQTDPLIRLFHLLYRNEKGQSTCELPMAADLMCCFLWFSRIKKVFAEQFPNLMKPATESAIEDFDIIKSMNAQIRALTDGDITKEDQVLQRDCWRALTELDAKAREAAEIKRMQEKSK